MPPANELTEPLAFTVRKVELRGKAIALQSRFRPGGGTLGISGWECAAGTLEPLAYTRASSAEFC